VIYPAEQLQGAVPAPMSELVLRGVNTVINSLDKIAGAESKVVKYPPDIFYCIVSLKRGNVVLKSLREPQHLYEGCATLQHVSNPVHFHSSQILWIGKQLLQGRNPAKTIAIDIHIPCCEPLADMLANVRAKVIAGPDRVLGKIFVGSEAPRPKEEAVDFICL
jgi:hypothetical protein